MLVIAPATDAVCDVASGSLGWIGDVACATTSAVDTASEVLDFASNPLEYIAQKIADGATSLLAGVTEWAMNSTAPDLSQEFWIATYKRGFAIGTILWGVIFAIKLAQSRRNNDGTDTLSDLGTWTLAYFMGVLFGPFVGQLLITGSGYLSAGIIAQWGGPTPGESLSSVNEAITDVATGEGMGGIIGAIIMLLGILISSLFLFISFCVMMAVTYLSSALFAIGFVWVLSPSHRKGAFKIPTLFVGLVAAQPILFLMLGMGLDIVRTGLFGDATGGRSLALLIMACIVFFLTAFTPLLLLKFVHVSPAGLGGSSGMGGGGTHVGMRPQPSGGGGGGGAKPSSQTAQAAAQRTARQAPAMAGAGVGGKGSPGAAGSAGGSGSSGSAGAAGSATGAASKASRAGGNRPSPVTGTPQPSPGTVLNGKPTGGAVGGRGAAGAAGGGARAGQRGSAASQQQVGGQPSAAAARLGGLAAARAATQTVGSAAARARRIGHNLTDNLDGDAPWR